MNTIQYKDYVATVSYDPEIDSFMGRVSNARDIITFYGKSTNELHQEFKNSIEDYIEFCKEEGVEPAKPYSGQFRLRISPDLHAQISAQAALRNESLNSFVNKLLSSQMDEITA